MTPDTLAALHLACFPDAPWSAASFADLLAQPTTQLLTQPDAFLLAQLIAPEAEILTLCVAPQARRMGRAQALLDTLKTKAETIFLDVARDNSAAQALYASAGFTPTGQRKGYYARPNAPSADAITLRWTAPGSSLF